MKKFLSCFLGLMLVATMFLGTVAFAAKDITVELDGQKIEFDVNPEIIDGRTLVPLRKIFEEIGALVKWNSETQTVSARKNSKTITLSIGSADLQIDKGKTDDEGNPVIETVALEVPAQIVSGRTLVPARAVSESFGLNVEWDEDSQKVSIISDDKDDDSWKENEGSINLSDLTYEGEGIEISGNQIKITSGGDFTLTGTMTDGNVTISSKEKVKLRLNGAKITSDNNPCIFVEKADKAYITITDGTENELVAHNSEDGAIYSKENLEIKGDGTLVIESDAGHGIKASDNMTIEKGNMVINAESDGIHINDTFKMSGGTVKITSIGDGIDCESIINISGGTIDITTNATPIEKPQTETEPAQTQQRRPMWEMDEADVEFEKSSKGINAEWMMVISDGVIKVDSASHAIHCQDEIEISGGKYTLNSKYDKGISAHGNLVISGAETEINVTKSTEAVESKNVMTINDGVIKAVSSDDAINATGGNSGMMMPGGNFGGNGQTPANQREQAPDGTEQENPWRGRGRNGQFSAMNPDGTMSENSEFVPPANFENGDFAPSFKIPENGEFTPPVQNRPQMNFNDGTFPGGMGGFGRNMKECLIINGGYLELCGNDDCIDANGNMTINGGTIKAANPTGAFTGNFGVLDADGQITIGENANIILASGSGRALNTTHNTIIVYCENTHDAGDKITLSDSKGNVLYEYAPAGNYKAVLIISGSVVSGEKYSITIGEEIFETEITQQSTIIGTQTSGGMGFDRRPTIQ